MVTENTRWHHAVPGQMISSNEVHIWRLLLHEHSSHIESIKRNLSTDELARAGKFHFEKDQNRFVMARGILRMILAGYLGMKPHELRFEYTSNGKPILAAKPGYDTLSFNLSHSGTFALYAVTHHGNIGVDIEYVRDDVVVGQIAQRFFSPGEISSLEKIHKNKLTEVFYQYWTRKEAFLKATGEGVSFPMEQCDVSLINGRVLSPITLLGDHRENSCWFGQDLFPGQCYAAAIAVEGRDWDLSFWDYSV